MIIFGLSVFFFGTIGEGVFHCPRCGGDRHYKHKSGRRWFTLFFAPVIPLDKVGEIVRCETCRGRFDPEVLSIPTAERMAAAGPSGLRAAAVLVLAAGDPSDPGARARAVGAIRGAGASGYCEAALDADLAQPPAAAEQALRGAASALAPHGRERLVAEAARVGLAAGPLTDGQRQALLRVGDWLGLTPAQAYGVVALAEQGAQRG